MELIIIKGPIASGKTLIAQMLHKKLKNPLLIKDATLGGVKKLIKEFEPNIIILDNSDKYKKEVIQYLQEIADVIKIINIEVYRNIKKE